MPIIRISNVDVDFPKDPPYPCQVEYMNQCIKAISSGANALLESPTGTGKTLCLLCSTLAWQYQQQFTVMKHNLDTKLSAESKMQVQSNPTSLIIYATRTHSQLSQIVSELRSTSYRPCMTVLGSREQLCVHDRISKLKGGVLNHACNALNSKRSCMYKNNLDNYLGTGKATTIADVEDLVKMGKSDHVCSYFYSREISTKADLVLLPYNYLLDSTIRNTLKLRWENSIIIFDEAHNLERVASDAASCSLTSTDIAACIKELQQVLTLVKDISILKASEVSGNTQDGKKNSLWGGSDNTDVGPPTMATVVVLLRAMFDLEKNLDSLLLKKDGPGVTPCAVLNGDWIRDWFERAGLSRGMHRTYISELRKSSLFLMAEAENALGGFDSAGSGGAPLAASEPKLAVFIQLYERVIQANNRNLWQDYKVFVSEEGVTTTSKWNHSGDVFSAKNGKSSQKKRVVNFWSFSPGIALEELKGLHVRSIILTSGTLSPMESIKEDMKIPFTVQLENPHVIENSQIWVGAISKGISSVSFNSSYANRDNNDYKDELGSSILSICLTMLGRNPTQTAISKTLHHSTHVCYKGIALPKGSELKGGVLVFFPSYASMESVVDRWKGTGLFEQLKDSMGNVLMEPKGSFTTAASTSLASATATKRTSFMSHDAVTASGSEVNDPMKGIVGQFDAIILKYGVCLLLAVCRGKVSEGIDFSDNKGRVVIITGIPFAPFTDAWVVLKKQYLDERCCSNSVVSRSTSIHRGEVPSNYQSEPSNPATTLTPYVRIPQKGQNENIRQNLQTVNTVGLKSNLWLNAMPSDQLAAVTSQNGSSNQSIQRPKGSLTGQSWYTQSANRAVNQCLGRIIRHKNDWGAVFLMDDRFQHEQQRNQLSSWVKPRMQKYNDFSIALTAFRDFLTLCMKNPSLTTQRTDVQHLALKSSSGAGSSNKRLLSNDAILRKVDVLVDNVDNDGDITFVNPTLLLTQTNGSNLMQSSTSVASSRPLLTSTSRSNSTHSNSSNASNHNPVDLVGVFQKMTGKLPIPAASNNKFDKVAVHNSVIVPARKTISHYFGLQSQSQSSTATIVTSELKASNDSVDFALDNSKTTTQNLEKKPVVHSFKAVVKGRMDAMSDTITFSQQHAFPQLLDDSSVVSGKDVIKQLAVELKKYLDPECMKKLRNELLKSKESGITYISQVSSSDVTLILFTTNVQAKGFLDRLMDILSPMKSNRKKLDALLKLSCILPPDLVNSFKSMAELACTIQNSNSSSSCEKESQIENGKGSSSSSSSSSSSDVAPGASTNCGSKRARLMLSSCTPSTAAVGSKSLSARFEAIDQLVLRPTPSQSSSMLSSSEGGRVSTAATRSCGICKCAASVPCAARCGHICCRVCWARWLAVKLCCPFCNAAASMDKLTILQFVHPKR